MSEGKTFAFEGALLNDGIECPVCGSEVESCECVSSDSTETYYEYTCDCGHTGHFRTSEVIVYLD